MDNDFGNDYAWMGKCEKIWETNQSNMKSFQDQSTTDMIQNIKRRQMDGRHESIQIGLIRNTIVIIDSSEAMVDRDLKPNRFSCAVKQVEGFVEEYFDCNSISRLSLMALRNKKCELLTDLGGNRDAHLKSLANFKKSFPGGSASLYNGLEQAFTVLKNVPGHVSREIIVIFGSLSTVDPFDIDLLIKDLKTSGIICSIIGLATSLRICDKICQETKGKYRIPLDENHFKAILQEHLLPPISPEGQESCQMKMGFPQFDNTPEVRIAMCMRHLGTPEERHCSGKGGYLCPQCGSKHCELPVDCKCGLPLISSAHLARSYLHLFPLEPFDQIPTLGNSSCHGCLKQLTTATSSKCRKCNRHFCVNCDIFIHESLRICPGC